MMSCSRHRSVITSTAPGEEIVSRLRATQGKLDTLNVDMIFTFPCRPGQRSTDLSILTELGADQITYYPLMPSSYAAEAMRKRLGGSVDFRREKGFYNLIADTLSAQYTPSTAWCFSRSDALIDEYVVNFDEYAGLGSGSIGYLGGSVYANTFDIGDYIARVNKGAFPLVGRKDSSLKEQLRYDFLMKLFGLELDLEKLAAKFNVNVYQYLWSEIVFLSNGRRAPQERAASHPHPGRPVLLGHHDARVLHWRKQLPRLLPLGNVREVLIQEILML